MTTKKTVITEVDLEFKHEIVTKEVFSRKVENRLNTIELSPDSRPLIHETILDICEDLDIEPEDCKKLLTADLKRRLKEELINLNMIRL